MQKIKNTGIVYIIFSQLFNVYFIQWVLSDDGHISSVIPKVFLWSICILLIAIGLLKLNEKCIFKKVYDNVIFSCFIFFLCMYIAIAGDRLVGRYISKSGIVFEPNTTVYYKTLEFSFTAKINSLGFRDKEYAIDKKKNYRVLTIGDSFTYGWGNDINSVWSSIIEKNLINKGYKIELLNLGKTGATPKDYTTIACKAIPILKPDLVIIGFLQGDDIMQIVEENQLTKSFWNHDLIEFDYHALVDVRYIAQKLFPNYIRLFTRKKTIEIGNTWKQDAVSIFNSLSYQEKQVFHTFPKHIQTNYFNGEIYPWVVISGIKNPNYFILANDSSRLDVKQSISTIKYYFSRIKQISHQYHSKVLLISIPAKPFVCRRFNTEQMLGYYITEGLIDSNTVDIMAEKIANNLGFGFFKCSNEFIKSSDSIDLFFKYDGHLNTMGNELLAHKLEPVIEKIINQ